MADIQFNKIQYVFINKGDTHNYNFKVKLQGMTIKKKMGKCCKRNTNNRLNQWYE